MSTRNTRFHCVINANISTTTAQFTLLQLINLYISHDVGRKHIHIHYVLHIHMF